MFIKQTAVGVFSVAVLAAGCDHVEADDSKAAALDSADACLRLADLDAIGFGGSANNAAFDRQTRGWSQDDINALALSLHDDEFDRQCRDTAWAAQAEAYLAAAVPYAVRDVECRTTVCRVSLAGSYAQLGMHTLPAECHVGSSTYLRLESSNATVAFISRCGFAFSADDGGHVRDVERLDFPFP